MLVFSRVDTCTRIHPLQAGVHRWGGQGEQFQRPLCLLHLQSQWLGASIQSFKQINVAVWSHSEAQTPSSKPDATPPGPATVSLPENIQFSK